MCGVKNLRLCWISLGSSNKNFNIPFKNVSLNQHCISATSFTPYCQVSKLPDVSKTTSGLRVKLSQGYTFKALFLLLYDENEDALYTQGLGPHNKVWPQGFWSPGCFRDTWAPLLISPDNSNNTCKKEEQERCS